MGSASLTPKSTLFHSRGQFDDHFPGASSVRINHGLAMRAVYQLSIFVWRSRDDRPGYLFRIVEPASGDAHGG
jgi:hypothetical protein